MPCSWSMWVIPNDYSSLFLTNKKYPFKQDISPQRTQKNRHPAVPGRKPKRRPFENEKLPRMIPEEYHGEIEKPHRRENPKLACIINGGQDLIARTFKRQNRPCRKIPPENEYILHRQLDIYCNCPWIYTSSADAVYIPEKSFWNKKSPALHCIQICLSHQVSLSLRHEEK